MIHPSPSAMMPSGAICTRPSRSVVVTTVSRIIGMSGLGEAAQGVPHFSQPRQVFGRSVDRAAPIERLVLRVALAEPPGDLRLHQLGAEIERMRRVALHPELG